MENITFPLIPFSNKVPTYNLKIRDEREYLMWTIDNSLRAVTSTLGENRFQIASKASQMKTGSLGLTYHSFFATALYRK